MNHLDEVIRQLQGNALAMDAMFRAISEEQAQWKPDSDTWCLKEVMEHVYNEERKDFRMHLKEIFSTPPLPWGALDEEEYLRFERCSHALEGFLKEREDSILWLKALESPNWDLASKTTFGPQGSQLVLRAGDILVSWVEHDFLHMRQMIELRYAWNEKQASPYSVEYAGGW